ncbi:MAG: GNAT family N-acetyltransferase [Methanomicrobiaceae archaeon]|nr:GNAT family N-acetyltransferase [Methanomicrobiaceae archaeon]
MLLYNRSRRVFFAESGGEPVATAAVVNDDGRFAFGGLFIVREDLRGHGIGARIIGTAIKHAGDRIIGIDVVAAMQQKYRDRSGFQFAFRSVRFERRGGGTGADGPVAAASVPFSEIALL